MPKVRLLSRTLGCCSSPYNLSLDRKEVPLLIHIHEEQGGPPCNSPSSTTRNAIWQQRMNPLLSIAMAEDRPSPIYMLSRSWMQMIFDIVKIYQQDRL